MAGFATKRHTNAMRVRIHNFPKQPVPRANRSAYAKKSVASQVCIYIKHNPFASIFVYCGTSRPKETSTMASSSLPTHMKAWQFNAIASGLEKSLVLNSNALPPPAPTKDQSMVEVLSMALNPVDYKVRSISTIPLFLLGPSMPCHNIITETCLTI